MTPTTLPGAPLQSLVPVLITGADARSFLQGQLSNDLARLTPQQALLASCNSAQGRVQAVLTLVARDEGLLALVPAQLLDATLARLRAFVLRAKVAFASGPWVAVPLSTLQAAELSTSLPSTPGHCTTAGAVTLLRWWSGDARYLALAPRASVGTLEAPLADAAWQRADIAAGLPQIHPQTREAFVAQMLNLDLLGAISFTKGCYTGQEIVARTHYRGSVKRRMFRFATTGARLPSPGTRLMHGTVHAGDVVAAAATAAGCDLLAVVGLDHAGAALALDGGADAALTRLDLPYALP